MHLPISNEKLKELLIREHLVNDEDWQDAEHNATRRRRGISDILIERGIFSEKYLYELLATALKIPYVNLRTVKVDELVVRMLPEEIAHQTRCIAFGKDTEKNAVKIACVDPLNDQVKASIEAALKQPIEIHLMNERSFRYAARLYNADIKQELLNVINEHAQKAHVSRSDNPSELPIVNIFNTLLEFALLEQSSDVHIEPLADAVLVRFRVDGELHDKIELPLSVREALIARIKILSDLKLDEHRIPQDGRMTFKVDGEEESARVSIIPTLFGEKAVMRLLSDEMQYLSLQDIGLSKQNLQIILKYIKRPFGMILVVGPTGSGKTTTLYAILNILNTEDVNISTIEDPIEYGIRRVNQTQVNMAAGYTFASGLRALLRQDPDTIMIGEIRDGETAQIAVRAALTGHLLLSTLHTNNAAGAPPRLLDMGVEPFLVASTLNLVIAQRLVRRLCRQCIATYSLTPAEVRSLAKEFDLRSILKRMQDLGVIDRSIMHFSELSFYRGKGCAQCHGSGFTGRMSVVEILVNTQALQQAIIKRMSSEDIETIAANDGMIPIFDDAMQKALLGITSLEEVLRVVKD